jgi:hypothetical protein
MTGARSVHDTLDQAGWAVEIAAQKVNGLAPLACKTDKIDSREHLDLYRRGVGRSTARAERCVGDLRHQCSRRRLPGYERRLQRLAIGKRCRRQVPGPHRLDLKHVGDMQHHVSVSV